MSAPLRSPCLPPANCPQTPPTGPNPAAPQLRTRLANPRLTLVAVSAPIPLITQRSLVQIQPPQPPKSKAWVNPRLLIISDPFAATVAR